MKSYNREFCRFLFLNGINTLAGYLIYAFLLLFLPYLAAYSVVYVISIFFSYLLNSRFVFKQGLGWNKAIRYPLVYLTQYLLGTLLLYVFVQKLMIDTLIAPGLVVLLSLPVTYFLSRRILAGKVRNNQN